MTTAKIAAENSAFSTRAALASVALALILLVAKAWAAYATDSTAMLGSLADTALDVIASITTLVGVRIAAVPADSDHRFGHGKAEALVALAQVALISVSAIGIALARDRSPDQRRADRGDGPRHHRLAVRDRRDVRCCSGTSAG